MKTEVVYEPFHDVFGELDSIFNCPQDGSVESDGVQLLNVPSTSTNMLQPEHGDSTNGLTVEPNVPCDEDLNGVAESDTLPDGRKDEMATVDSESMNKEPQGQLVEPVDTISQHEAAQPEVSLNKVQVVPGNPCEPVDKVQEIVVDDDVTIILTGKKFPMPVRTTADDLLKRTNDWFSGSLPFNATVSIPTIHRLS